MSYNQNVSLVGLNSFTWIAPVAGPAFFDGKISVPTVVGGGGASQVVTTITQNSTNVYTGLAGAEGFHLDLTCALNDSIVIAFTSSAAPDQPLNAVKAVIAIGSGQ